jgi:glucan phosphorylase
MKYSKPILDRPLSPDLPSIAYFSMEFGIHPCLKIYSGGLGILAGDYLKEASDSNLNITGVGLLYRYGYFKQKLGPNGENSFQFMKLKSSRVFQLIRLKIQMEIICM